LVDEYLQTGLLGEYPEVQAWTEALLADSRVQNSVPDNFNQEFVKNLQRRDLYAGSLMPQAAAG
jgi:hypothetical protein